MSLVEDDLGGDVLGGTAERPCLAADLKREIFKRGWYTSKGDIHFCFVCVFVCSIIDARVETHVLKGKFTVVSSLVERLRCLQYGSERIETQGKGYMFSFHHLR